MENNKFLLYGANGYTGRLIAGLAASYGLVPVLAGRNKKSIVALAKELDLDYRIFSLKDTRSLENSLLEVPLVLHAAGPFQFTSRLMIEACLKTNTHYLDITGEISVFEQAKRFDEKAKAAGLMIMSGVGFDVVPTDCMAITRCGSFKISICIYWRHVFPWNINDDGRRIRCWKRCKNRW